MPTVVAVEQLSVVLGGFPALKKLNVRLEQGKITGFIGPSGAGKTTLIRSIVGRQHLSAGKITVLGLPAGSPQLRGRLSYMTQEISVYNDLSVQENIVYFAAMTGYFGARGRQAAGAALAAVDMTDKAAVLVRNLSGGQKQRVSLAVALIGDPELLVLDEPTVGLDPVLREQLWQLFRKLAAAGKTLIISSHAMDEAERCDDLLLIRDGQAVAHDTPRILCERTGTHSVEQAFLKLVGDAT